jgi:hypothetical protein
MFLRVLARCGADLETCMTTTERQIALSVLESLRGDLVYAHLNNGSRVLDVADLRQYIYEQMSRIRTNALVTDGLYGNDNGHGQDISKSNGHNGEMAWRLKSSLFSSPETTLRLCRNIEHEKLSRPAVKHPASDSIKLEEVNLYKRTGPGTNSGTHRCT